MTLAIRDGDGNSVNLNSVPDGTSIRVYPTTAGGYSLRLLRYRTASGESDLVVGEDGYATYTVTENAVFIALSEPTTAYSVWQSVQHATVDYLSGVNSARQCLPGDTVTFRASASDGYVLTDVAVYQLPSLTELEITKEDEGTYSFTMPSGEVRIAATAYPTVALIQPEDGGTLSFSGSVASSEDGTHYASAGYEVSVKAVPYDGYYVSLVRATYPTRGVVGDAISDGNGVYHIIMQDYPVEFTAIFARENDTGDTGDTDIVGNNDDNDPNANG